MTSKNSPETRRSCPPILTKKLSALFFPSTGWLTQWAAVTTYWSLRRLPPQMNDFFAGSRDDLWKTATAHGQELGTESVPPTIGLMSGRIPQPFKERDKKRACINNDRLKNHAQTRMIITLKVLDGSGRFVTVWTADKLPEETVTDGKTRGILHCLTGSFRDTISRSAIIGHTSSLLILIVICSGMYFVGSRSLTSCCSTIDQGSL